MDVNTDKKKDKEKLAERFNGSDIEKRATTAAGQVAEYIPWPMHFGISSMLSHMHTVRAAIGQ